MEWRVRGTKKKDDGRLKDGLMQDLGLVPEVAVLYRAHWVGIIYSVLLTGTF